MKQFERKGGMKILETSGIPIMQIKGIPRIPMRKKMMKLDDYAEFVDMVVSFAYSWIVSLQI